MPMVVIETAGRAGTAVEDPGRLHAAFASEDGSVGFAVYEAEDVADGGAGPGATARWSAVALAPPVVPGDGSLFVVEERFDPPVPLDQAAPQSPDLSPCLRTYGVTWVASFIATDGTQCRCVYRAADGDAVRRAYRTAGVPFTKVWRAIPGLAGR